MSIGINPYSGIQGHYKTQSKTTAEKTKESDYLDLLRTKYKDLNIQVGTEEDANASDHEGTSVFIHPDELKRMADDPEYAQKMERVLAGVSDIVDALTEKVQEKGANLVGFQLLVNENGETDAWLFGQDENANDTWMQNIGNIQDLLTPKSLLDHSV